MKRFATLSALAFVLSTMSGFAQTAPPAQRAKFVPPVKGHATIEVVRGASKRTAKDVVTTVKVRNTSKGSINLLKIEQYWYDRNSKQVSFGDYAHRKAPILPGEIVEITLSAPSHAQISHDMLMFTHAYGKIEAKQVKKFE